MYAYVYVHTYSIIILDTILMPKQNGSTTQIVKKSEHNLQDYIYFGSFMMMYN